MNRLTKTTNDNYRRVAADAASFECHAANRRTAAELPLRRNAASYGALQRTGAIVVEIVVCSVMLAAVSLILVPALTAVSRQRQEIRFKTLAMTEINNLHQDLLREATAGKSPLSIEKSDLQLSDWFRRRYADASLQVTLLPVVAAAETVETVAESDVSAGEPHAAATMPALVPVRVSISRPSGVGRPDLTSSLVVWVADRTDVSEGVE